MFDINNITRANIRELKPYSSARDEFSSSTGIFLDANENPYGELNRYPDPYQRELKLLIKEYSDLDTENIFVGNGSDEIIDLLFRIFCTPSKDKVLTFVPTYGMYDVVAEINDVEMIKVNLNDDFDIDYESVKPFLSDPNLKIILICSPNNPTGNCLNSKLIEKILKSFNGIVLVDEAYIDFCESKSFIKRITEYPNLIVSQTMSKAWGLASARVGLAFANSDVIDLLNKVKPPYNVSGLNQNAAINAIKNYTQFLENKQRIIEEKNKLFSSLETLEIVKKIFPSEANFFLVEMEDADQVYNRLVNEKIIVRNRNKVVRNCIRITVGTAEENQLLIQALKSI
jgi:histidinol-phosphate aminotransferase